MANKTDLIKGVQGLLKEKELDFNKDKVGTIVEAVLDTIIGLTDEDEKLQLIGFGTFSVKERAARKGLNPKKYSELLAQGLSEEDAKAQAEVEIKASKSVGFKVGKAFKTFIQE